MAAVGAESQMQDHALCRSDARLAARLG